MPRLSISVCLCTYNGAEFLDEQLESIASQTRLPDQLVMLDDGSTDDTVARAQAFGRVAPFQVEVGVNPSNVGYARNFGAAIARASGEVILLADQDDRWAPTKLERMAAVFERAPEVGLVFSDADLVDAHMHALGVRLWEAVGFSAARQAQVRLGAAFDVLLRGSVVTGAAMAFRSSLRELVLPIGDDCDHDAWISLLAAAVRDAAIIPEPLVLYRQHGANQIGARKLTLLERIERARHLRGTGLSQRRELFQKARQRLQDWKGAEARREKLREAIEHLTVRLTLPRRRLSRIPPIASETFRGRYRRMGEGLPSAIRDFVL